MKRWKSWLVLSSLSTLLLVHADLAVARGGIQAKASQPGTADQTPVEFVSVAELRSMIAKNEPVSILDVRSNNTYITSNQKIKGASHLNPRKIKLRAGTLSKDRQVVTYCACQGDATSIRVARTLLGMGFKKVRVLKGGWGAWIQSGGPIEPALHAANVR